MLTLYAMSSDQQELAGCLASLQILVRLARLLEGIPSADPHLELALLDQIEQLSGALLQELRRADVGGECGALHVERTARGEDARVERIGAAARGAVQDHPAGRPERHEPVEKRGLADAVVDRGDAFAAGDLLRAL